LRCRLWLRVYFILSAIEIPVSFVPKKRKRKKNH
jgi:hypothetical protein